MEILMLIGIMALKYPEIVIMLLIIWGLVMLSLSREDDKNVDR